MESFKEQKKEKREAGEKKLEYVIEFPNHPTSVELLSMLEKYDPEKMLKEITKKHLDINSYKIVHNESLGDKAEWIENKGAEVNFNKGAKYVWLCVAHEMAHQFLQEKPTWQNLDEAADIIKRNNSYKSEKYNYTFQYAVEQAMACLLQAACEDKGPDTRPIQWERWKDTFEAMVVKDFAEKFWEPFIGYLKDNSNYQNIDYFILETLQKNY